MHPITPEFSVLWGSRVFNSPSKPNCCSFCNINRVRKDKDGPSSKSKDIEVQAKCKIPMVLRTKFPRMVSPLSFPVAYRYFPEIVSIAPPSFPITFRSTWDSRTDDMPFGSMSGLSKRDSTHKTSGASSSNENGEGLPFILISLLPFLPVISFKAL